MKIEQAQLKNVVQSNRKYARGVWIFALILILAAGPIQRILGLSGAQNGWSLTQLWYSVRDNYFFNNPAVYIFQGDYTGSFNIGALVLGIVCTIGGGYLLVWLFSLLLSSGRNLKQSSNLQGTDLLAYANIAAIEDDVFAGTVQDTIYRIWEVDHNGRTYKVALKGTNVVVATTLKNALPHMLIDALGNRRSPARKMDPNSEVVLDGVMFNYFRVFVAANAASAVTIFTPLLNDLLIRYGSFSDIQIRNSSFVMYVDAKDMETQLNNNAFFDGVDSIVDELERVTLPQLSQVALTFDASSKLADTLLLRKHSRAVKFSIMLAFLFILWTLLLAIKGFQESTTMALLTLLTILIAILAASSRQRNLL